MRRSYQTRKLERHSRKPAELLLVPMIDIFTVLVTFLLMTAVFSRTVILQLNLPPPQTEFSCRIDRKSTRLNSSHSQISYAVFCLKKKKKKKTEQRIQKKQDKLHKSSN